MYGLKPIISLSLSENSVTTTKSKTRKRTVNILSRNQNGRRFCDVCGDLACGGLCYGAVSCVGCKSFFRRLSRKGLSDRVVCRRGNGKCTIDIINRSNCSRCRYEKCLRVGMRRIDVTAGENTSSVGAKELELFARPRRHADEESAPILKNALLSVPLTMPVTPAGPVRICPATPASVVMNACVTRHSIGSVAPHQAHADDSGFSVTDASLSTSCSAPASSCVTADLEAMNVCFSMPGVVSVRSAAPTEVNMCTPRSMPALSVSSPSSPQTLSLSVRLSNPRINVTETAQPCEGTKKQARIIDVCESMEQQLLALIEWVKPIKAFSNLSLCDRVALVRAHACEHMLLQASFRSLSVKESILLGNNTIASRSSKDPIVALIAARVLDELIVPLRQIQMDGSELIFLKALLLFDPRTVGLSDANKIRSIRLKILVRLENYISNGRQFFFGRFGECLLLLPVLQSIAWQVIENVSFVKVCGVEKISSLLQEFFLGAGENEVHPSMFGFKMTPETLPDMPPTIPSTQHFPLYPPVVPSPVSTATNLPLNTST